MDVEEKGLTNGIAAIIAVWSASVVMSIVLYGQNVMDYFRTSANYCRVGSLGNTFLVLLSPAYWLAYFSLALTIWFAWRLGMLLASWRKSVLAIMLPSVLTVVLLLLILIGFGCR